MIFFRQQVSLDFELISQVLYLHEEKWQFFRKQLQSPYFTLKKVKM